MKAVAAALVLIAGAGVVLWYGNMLNSWVLGGLVGGLAALLLSIPISLTLFSYFSRRHDERVRAEAQEELLRAQEAIYAEDPERFHELYEVDSSLELMLEEERPVEYERRGRPTRHLPPPDAPRLPAPRDPRGSRNMPVTQRGTHRPAGKPIHEERPVARETEKPGRRITRRIDYQGAPGKEVHSHRSLYQSQALRTARLEAARQLEQDDVEVLPTHFSRPARDTHHHPSAEWFEPEEEQSAQSLRPSEHDLASSRDLRQYPRRPRMRKDVVDAIPPQPSTSRYDVPRSLPGAGESSVHQTNAMQRDTENIFSSPQTGPIDQTPQGQMARHPQVDERYRKKLADETGGNIAKPIIRRAPYTYEDDPIRQELSQYIEPPVVRRRSSRLETEQQHEENE